MIRILLIPALLLSGLACALGRVVTLDEILKHHWGSIDTIIMCGRWQHQEQSGTYRIVHAKLYGQSMLYVEWLSRDDDIGAWQVVNSIGLDRINNDHASISLEDLKCVPTDDGIVLNSMAWFGHEDAERKVSFRFGHSLGDYSYDF